mmetsp:Transcript_24368/g.51026  ORF Transcript_24368/g.51026 Transcript_24368/m.51026 type:complete len:507 (-) Transcript_24368:616-2136(-)
MAGSSFGTIFRVSTFGESHCAGVGAILDGVPPRMKLSEADIQPQLTRRRPGQSRLTTPRAEKDMVTILSGVEHGYTLGTPIGLFVKNEDQRPGDYKEMSEIPRPGHADYTYLVKYGTKASSGGGRSSARETIGRVAAGAIAEKFLKDTYGTEISCWVHSIGQHSIPEEVVMSDANTLGWTREEVDRIGTLRLLRDPKWWKVITEEEEPDSDKRKKANIEMEIKAEECFIEVLIGPAKGEAELALSPCYEDYEGKLYNHRGEVLASAPANIEAWKSDELLPLRCPHPPTACRMATLIRQVKSEKDSIGGSVACVCKGVPPALGEPVFDRLEAKLAHAMLSLPATKGFEIGSGFGGTSMRGSRHNDPFVARSAGAGGLSTSNSAALTTSTNYAGGTLGGITSGTPIYFKVAVKPVSTIGQAQKTTTLTGEQVVLEAKGRHDPCVLPRTPPLVEGMAALVLADAALLQRTRLGGGETTVCDGTANFEPWMDEVKANGGDASAAKKPRRA